MRGWRSGNDLNHLYFGIAMENIEQLICICICYTDKTVHICSCSICILSAMIDSPENL